MAQEFAPVLRLKGRGQKRKLSIGARRSPRVLRIKRARRRRRLEFLWRERPSMSNVGISARHIGRINKALRYLQTAVPESLLFFRDFDPFSRTGNADTAWSILVDRRKQGVTITQGCAAPCPL